VYFLGATMATDWVKMRTDLYRDPKVILIADHLMAPGSDLSQYINAMTRRDSNVTRNVTRCATVGALVTLWGTLRHTGKRDNDDLIVTGGAIPLIDDIVDLAGFGEALASVGWVEVSKVGLVFPNFYRDYNADPDEKYRKNAAERQRKHRQKAAEQPSETIAERLRNSNVTVTQQGNATVTQCHTTEKRREEDRRVEEKREEKRTEEINTEIHPDKPDLSLSPKRTRRPSVAIDRPDDITEGHWRDWTACRRKPVTESVLVRIRREAAKAGISADEAIRTAAERQWEGFQAEWLASDRQLTTERKPSQPMTFGQLKEKNRNDVFERVFASGKVEAIFDAAERANGDEGDRAE
jgi:hypothetical protein